MSAVLCEAERNRETQVSIYVGATEVGGKLTLALTMSAQKTTVHSLTFHITVFLPGYLQKLQLIKETSI